MGSDDPIRTACSYCGVGCGITVHTATDPTTGHPVIARVAGDRLHPANFGRLCTKGATHAELMRAHDGRLTTALLRHTRDAEPTPVAVDDAIATAGRRLRAIIDAHGPDAVALYVSGQLTLEAQYLATKLAKGFLRTMHLESNSRLCMTSASTGFSQSLGADGPPGSYADFDCTNLFFVIGSNMADCHPVLFQRMTDRLKAGAKLIVVDPRRTATADAADLYLPIRPGTDLALLNGLLRILVDNGDIDHGFIAEHTEGWDTMAPVLADYPPHRVAQLTGLAESDIRAAATMIAAAGQWLTCWTMGLNQSTQGTHNTNAICNLHLATGAICRPGAGPMSLTGQPNAMGGREMGYLGGGLPGQRSVFRAEDRAFVEQQWGRPPGTIRATAGPGTVGMFDAMAAGRIKACWIICTNPVASMPNRGTVLEALRTAELVITQDAYRDTATNRYADIVLPAALWAESEGVMVNSERTLTLLPRSLPPLGQARPDWQLICDLATELGFGADFDYRSSAQVFDEIRRFWNPRTGYDLRGADYTRLRASPLQWPCPPVDSPDGAAARHPIRYRNDGISQQLHIDADGRAPRLAFPTPSRRAVFLPRRHRGPQEQPNAEFPLLLNTGRLAHQWHSMTKTATVAALNNLTADPHVEIHPDDATRCGVTDGQPVRLASRRGHVVLAAKLTDRVQPGSCFAAFHWNDEQGRNLTVNAVTTDAVDPDSLQPEFKVCAVALTPAGPPPLELAGPPARPAPTVARAAPRIADAPLVLWASQTGTAEQFARHVGDRLQGAELVPMNDGAVPRLAAARDVVVITSTFGDGGPPDHATGFFDRLHHPDAPALDHLRYAVLGIGDRAYPDFCGHARSIDGRLAALGATRLRDRLDCEAHDDTQLTGWVDELGTLLDRELTPTRSAPITRAQPIAVRLCRNQLLTPPTSGKEVRQFGFDISGSDLDYRVGDSLGVYATNSAAAVTGWLAATGLSGAEAVTVDGVEQPLRTALTAHYDICRVTPDLLRFVADRCADRAAAAVLGARRAELDRWLMNRNGLDVVREFPVRAEPGDWQQVLVRLTPRQYSISSSPLIDPHEVQLTVSVLRYRGSDGGARGGVAGTFLADRAAAEPVPVFVQRAPHFRPPADGDTPIIMVGPGTGVAPFRAFLQDRLARGATGANWLFFGDRHRAENYYYRDDFDALRDAGVLTRLSLAFSRDPGGPRYVQHAMLDDGAELWRWLAAGAHLYVCGDAARMAKDVDAALSTIIRTHGGLSAEDAHDYKKELIATKRYVRDVY